MGVTICSAFIHFKFCATTDIKCGWIYVTFKSINVIKVTLPSKMKLTSLIRHHRCRRYLSLIHATLRQCFRSWPEISGVHNRTILMDHLAYPDVHTGNIRRMRNYRLPDAQLQIAGCAMMRNYRSLDAQLQIARCVTIDRRMCYYRSPDVHISDWSSCRMCQRGRTEKIKILAT